MAAIRLFESTSHAQIYAKFRPSYPRQLMEKIFLFAEKHGVGRDKVADIACGSGQSTFKLIDHFHHTVGVDISAAQISCAVEKAKEKGISDKVDFVVSSASSLPFEDESVDVITCAQAWHWLEPEAIFSEIDRVLKKPGALAVYGYGRGVMRHDECERILSHYYSHTLTWHNNRKFVNNLYRDVKLPYPVAERHDIKDEKAITLDELKGYLSTWSAYLDYCEKHPGTEVLEDLMKEMEKLLKQGPSTDALVHLDTPYFLILCLKE